MKLLRFRVTGFRSVDDSEWVDVTNVTSLIGTNESGKTNLLLPLWKLNPAKDGEIKPTSDYPRKRYNEIRLMDDKPIFVSAIFELDNELINKLIQFTQLSAESFRNVEVSKDFDDNFYVNFIDANPTREISRESVNALLDACKQEVKRAEPLKTEIKIQEAILESIDLSYSLLKDNVNSTTLRSIKGELQKIDTEKATAKSSLFPPYIRLIDSLTELQKGISFPHPNENAEARKLVRASIPKFVYYSNYGNLDSEIYLPHVIANLKRLDLGSKEEAKARTLKVLFEFVRLQPEEILELGKEYRVSSGKEPTAVEIEAIAEKKKERSILLQSASTELTTKFREWWRQGEYRFRFEADGDHFRIWVSDDKRPEEIELEGRSTGLQWFLSFYLIFLVESLSSHENTILLLDEPGLSLHPLAQKDLSSFFLQLSETNQLLYTTHSPFLVDPDHLDRVRAVYVKADGTTGVSPDLRANESKSSQGRSVYPVHAALGLSISDTLFQGCQLVAVEGPSDLHYLSAMKNILIGTGRIKPNRELVFIPAGGVSGMKAVVPIFSGKDEILPYVLLDADKPGQQMAAHLKSGLYVNDKDRVLSIEVFTELENSEVEDLMPHNIIAQIVDRTIRGAANYFSDIIKPNEPIIGQIESFAAAAGHKLETGWKVDLAKQVKSRLMSVEPSAIDDLILTKWEKLFTALLKH
jgi:hypothetical protein